MRRTINILMKILILSALFLILLPAEIYAEEELKVNITSDDGSTVITGEDHVIYTAVPVKFMTDADACYSLCIDGGETFGEYVPGPLALYPDDETSPSGVWKVKFAPTGDLTKESAVYTVCFDTASPELSVSDKTNVLIKDDTGIGRIIVKCEDKTIKEIHFPDKDHVGSYGFSLSDDECEDVSGLIDVYCYDLAGNSGVVSFWNITDTEAPVIYAEGVNDRARLSDACSLVLTATDTEGRSYINYTVKRQADDTVITTEGVNMEDRVELSFDEDGIYSVSAYAYDEAGNRSEEIHRDFTVDMTAPKVGIEGIYGEADQRSAASITFDISDNIYSGSMVDISLQRKVLDRIESIPIDSYSLRANRDIRTVNISSDGEYWLSVVATDSAGNSSECHRSFRIDSTPPEISISGTTDGAVSADVPVLRFCAGELFYDSTIMTAVLEKKTGSGYIQEKRSDAVMRSARDHVDITPEGEGEYRLTCTAADRSGNRSSSAVTFAIDYTPPVISALDDIDNGFFRSFSLPHKLSELVKDASAVSAHAYVDDKEFGDNDRMVDEGKYVLTILAEDKAGNTAESSAVFLVDHTSPQIVLSGLDPEGNIKKGSCITVALADEADRLVSVRFNGRNIAVAEDNTACIAVDEYGQYDLEILAEDEAGNVTDSAIGTSCYMSPNPLAGIRKVEQSELKETASAGTDLKGLLIGLASVLSGTLGLTYRAFYADR